MVGLSTRQQHPLVDTQAKAHDILYETTTETVGDKESVSKVHAHMRTRKDYANKERKASFSWQ